MENTKDVLLKTAKLTKRYRIQNAIDNVDVTIYRGDIYGFIGKNGAGKTTFIRLVTGVVNPTSGSFEFNFKVKKHGNISAIVETPSLFLNMTARDNLIQQYILLGKNDYHDIDELLHFVGLDYPEIGTKRVGNYSLGMKQRLSIAIALCSDPEFIVLDEPMNGLDPEGVVQIRELIKNLSTHRGITFLISSHMLEELSKVANRYGVIHQGKLIKEFTSEELMKSTSTAIQIETSDNEAAIKVLQARQIDATLTGRFIIVKDATSSSSVIKILSEANIDVHNFETIKEGIENYYLKLIGGIQNEQAN